MNKSAPLALVVAVVSILAATSASAGAIDTTAALAGVSDAQTAVVAVIGGMITFAIAVYGLKRVWRLFGG